MLTSKTNFIILGVTSLLCSRAMFAFFNDPEGPNLLIVFVAAAIIYSLSLVVYLFNPITTARRSLLIGILAQILIVTVSYFLLN